MRGLEGGDVAGNEAVLRARFEDARFFYMEDGKQPLEQFVPALSQILFHKDLGSLLDKTSRVEALLPAVAESTGLSGASSPSRACNGEKIVVETPTSE